MDYQASQALRNIANQQIDNARRYEQARKKAGEAQAALDLLMVPVLSDLRSQKKNLGIEMARLMLMETNQAARSFFKEWMEQEAIYKGLEKLIEAYASKISFEQSVMKYIGQGEKYGG